MSAFAQLAQQYVTDTTGVLAGAINDRQNAEAARAKAKYDAQQAQYARDQAAVAQLQGEREEARRARVLAYDIGSHYADWAGNGLMVDGNGKDTLGDVLRTTVTEATDDIKTIRDNATMNVWTYQREASLLAADAAGYSQMSRNLKGRSKLGLMTFPLGIGGQHATMAYSLYHPTTYNGYKA